MNRNKCVVNCKMYALVGNFQFETDVNQVTTKKSFEFIRTGVIILDKILQPAGPLDHIVRRVSIILQDSSAESSL